MRKILIFLYVLAAVFICSPLFVHQWIHGDYSRYLWIINQPYPLSHLGGVTYQLILHSGLVLLGISILLVALGVQFSRFTSRSKDDSVDIYNNQGKIKCLMTNFLKKYLLHILIGLGLVVLLGTILFFTFVQKALTSPVVVEETEYLVTDLGDGWSRYTDIPYAFSIDFPSANGERPFVETHSPGNYPDFYSVGFRAKEGDMETFGAMVIPTGFADAEAWLTDRKKGDDEFSEYVLERRVQVADTEALVTYWRETPENEAPYENRERQTAFSRDGTVYVIGTRGMSLADTVRTWESFRFLEPDISNPPALIDGKEYYLGTYQDSPIVNGMKSHVSEQFAIALDYPESYLLFESETEDAPQAQFSFVAGSIVLGLDLPVRQSIVRAEAGRGGGAPGGIVLTYYQPQDQSLSLEEWLRTNPSGNFNPEFAPDAELSLTPTTVSGISALKYHSDFGMYPTDYVAFTYKDWYVLASDQTDTKNDFDKVLSTIVIQ